MFLFLRLMTTIPLRADSLEILVNAMPVHAASHRLVARNVAVALAGDGHEVLQEDAHGVRR